MNKQHDLEKIKVILHQKINHHLLNQKEKLEEYGDFINYVIEGYLWGERPGNVEIKYPNGWWQAFKELFYPKFALRCWPVKYKVHTISFNVLYPFFTFASPEHKIITRHFERVV
jgi:hypothetical protein